MRLAFQARPLMPLVVLWACCSPLALADTAERLAADCDALLRDAVRKPYGWAWARGGEDLLPLPRGAAVVSLEPRTTPAAGILLQWVGDALGRTDYTDAARHAARGVAAAQDSTGRVPAYATFGLTVTGREPATSASDRASTRAALALLLAVVREKNPEDEPLRRSAVRAAHWLEKQQAAKGAWPVLYPPDAKSGAKRLFRLDTPDYRDSTLAMLHAADLLNDASLRRSAERAARLLLEIRPERSQTAKGLWQAAYNLGGVPSDEIRPADAVDLLATRHAAQTLLAFAAFTGDEAAAEALNATRANLLRLHYDTGEWERHYPLNRSEVRKPADAPAPPPDPGPFKPDPEDQATLPGTFGLPPVLDELSRLADQGAKTYRTNKTKDAPFRRQIALALCGMDDDLFGARPTDPKAASERLQRLDENGLAAGPRPDSLQERTHRVRLLLERLELERIPGR